MASRETIEITLAGHQLRLTVTPEERVHVEQAGRRVHEMIQKLQASSGGASSPAKIATMAAFQMAFELVEAEAHLGEAAHLHEELNRQRDAVQRLESLLSRVDDALAY